MLFRSGRFFVPGVHVVIAALFLAGCGGIENTGEVSDNTLLDENRPPVAFGQHLVIDSSAETNVTVDGAVPIMLRARDDDGDPLTYTIIQKPSHGILLGEPPNLQFLPDIGFTGTVYLVFRVNDGKEDSRTATVTIEIKTPRTQPADRAVHPPVAVDDNVTTDEDTNVMIEVLGNDRDTDGELNPGSLEITGMPGHGNATVVDGRVLYVPRRDYHGNDRLSYTVGDNEGLRSNEATVKIEVRPVNDAPRATDRSLVTREDTPLPLVLDGSDPDGDPLSYRIVTRPAHGTLSGTGRARTYTPAADYGGGDRFTFVVSDGSIESAEATVSITVIPVNDAPVAVDDNVTTDEGEAVTLEPLLNDSDPDGNRSSLKIISITQPESGIAKQDGKRVLYAPTQGSGATHDRLRYTIEDAKGARASASIRITILQHNDAPEAYSQSLVTREDQPVSFDLGASDPDGDPLVYTLTHSDMLPRHGTVGGTPPHLTYTPAHDFAGTDYVSFVVSDGNLTSPTAVVTISVLPVNDPPTADAGPDASGIRGDTFVLDGSGSRDRDGTIIGYEWKEGNTTIANRSIFDYRILSEGRHTLTLIVTDDHNATGRDEKIITVNPCCRGCIYPDPTRTNPFN